jgi:hypothetical protein
MAIKQKPTKWIALCLACFFLAVGCAHEMMGFPTREEGPPLLPRPAPYPLERPEGLEQRMKNLQILLEDPQLRPEDRLLAQDLLTAYQAFEKTSLSPMDEELGSFIRVLLSNLIRLDERYFASLSPEERDEARSMALFSEKRKNILDRYFSGDYQGVLDRAIELEERFGADSLSPEIGLVFALSLAKRGMVQEALRVGTRISDELERMPGVVELRARMVEWQLALGDKKGAVQGYEKLVDNVNETEAFLKGAERHISRHGLQKAPPPFPDLTQEPASVQEVLDQVDALVEKNDFDAAKLLLLRLAIRLQGGPEADRVDQAMKSVELAEEKAWDQERSDAFQKRETLELAASLIEQEKYEEAVAKIDGVAWASELGPEAKQLHTLAVEKIVNRQRNEAAKLFLMARNTQDPVKKEGLLVSSYNTLKNLVDQYPSTPMYQTINDNMKRIEEELAKVRKR